MPGMRLRGGSGRPAPLVLYHEIGNSIRVDGSDIVVLSTGAGPSTPALRLLLAADLTARYETAANDIVGIYGLVDGDAFTTNASGVITSAPDPVTRAAGVAPNYPMLSYASSLPVSANGRHMCGPYVITDEDLIGAVLTETTVITEGLIGQMVGIAITGTNPSTFKWSTAAAVKIGTIADVNRGDPLFNKTGGGGEVFVRVLSAYQQYKSGFNYAT